jgi:hypothetical protein
MLSAYPGLQERLLEPQGHCCLHGCRHHLCSLLTAAAVGLALAVLLQLVMVLGKGAVVLQHAWPVERSYQLHLP